MAVMFNKKFKKFCSECSVTCKPVGIDEAIFTRVSHPEVYGGEGLLLPGIDKVNVKRLLHELYIIYKFQKGL